MENFAEDVRSAPDEILPGILDGASPEGSDHIRERVARERQLRRSKAVGDPICCNAQMAPRQIRAYCALSRLRAHAVARHGAARPERAGHDRILKVARTGADLDGEESLDSKHIAGAIQYRTLDRTYWA